MIVGVCADKGAPGVTTLTVALAAVWPGEKVILEADPSGADLPFRLRAASTGEMLAPSPSVASLISTARLGSPARGLAPFAQQTTLGVPVVTGELTAERYARLRQMWPLVARVAAEWQGTALTDLGHLVPGNAAAPLAKAARLVLLLAPNSVEGLFRMRDRVVDLAAMVGEPAEGTTPIRVVVTGAPGSGRRALGDTQKVLASIGSPVRAIGFIPRDPKGAADLWAGEMTTRLARSPLIRAAKELAETILTDTPELAGAPTVTAPDPAPADAAGTIGVGLPPEPVAM